MTFTAIAAFLAYASATTTVDRATADAYEYLKAKLKDRFGEGGEITDAVSRLEDKPESESRKGVVREEVEQAGADGEPEIESAARALLDLLGSQPGGDRYTQTATGHNIAQAQDSSSASVEVRSPGEQETE